MKHAFIEAQQSVHRVDHLCAAVGVSRSGYYAWLGRTESQRVHANRTLLLQIHRIQAHGMRPSVSRKGNCYDNAVVESFFNSLKSEWVFHQTFLDLDQARAALFDYIELFYNRQRHHAALDYQSPVHFEGQHPGA